MVTCLLCTGCGGTKECCGPKREMPELHQFFVDHMHCSGMTQWLVEKQFAHWRSRGYENVPRGLLN